MAVLDPVAVLDKLKEVGEATAVEIGTTRAYLDELASEGLVATVGIRKTGKRGRPAVTFKVTKAGADKVRRAS